MAVDALIRVSFESNADASNAARRNLTGTQLANTPETPFQKLGSSAYSAMNASDADVAAAIAALAQTITSHSSLDFLSISVIRRS